MGWRCGKGGNRTDVRLPPFKREVVSEDRKVRKDRRYENRLNLDIDDVALQENGETVWSKELRDDLIHVL